MAWLSTYCSSCQLAVEPKHDGEGPYAFMSNAYMQSWAKAVDILSAAVRGC